MEQITRIGIDTSKHIFQLHGVNAADEPVLRKKLRRKEMMKFFDGLAPTRVAIEACGSSHHWARLLQSLGHEVKLIPPQFFKPYVKRNKNDAADAEALLRSVLVVGSTSLLYRVRQRGTGSPWLIDLLKRKPPKLAAVALANKNARIAWKLMVSGEHYRTKPTPATKPNTGFNPPRRALQVQSC